MLDFLYPKTCCFCGKTAKEFVCAECRKKLVYIEEPRCKKCGKPIRYEEAEYCHDCEQQTMCYEQGLSLWLHEGMVKESLYRFKYQNRRVYGKFYAEELYGRYKDKLKEWEIECIIPIPLHRRRRRKRGYNQAEIIATYLGNLSHIPVEKDAILRMTETKPQKELSQRERKRNLKNAFCVKKGWKPAKSVLLIDDIYTTGNTIHSVAKVLKEKGVRKVWFLTISIGQGF